MSGRLGRNEAMKQVAEWRVAGSVRISSHALKEMKKDDIESTDIENVLRCGNILEEGELVHDTWRYRVRTSKFVVVVAFSEEDERRLTVVTAWRLKKKGSNR